MAFGFSMNELMAGTHHFVDPQIGPPDETPFYFRIRWGQAFVRFLNPTSPVFMTNDAHGVINVTGLTRGEVPCVGTLELRYFGEHKLRYTLDFSVDGERYHYVGEKVDVKLWHPLFLVKTHTTCYGRLTNSHGQVISRSVTHFGLDMKTIVRFVSSFRLGL